MSRKSLVNLISNTNKDYASDFLSSLEYTITKRDALDTHPSSCSMSPSSMKCVRAMAMKLAGIKKDESKASPSLVLICRNGSDTHQLLQEYMVGMKDLGIDCEYLNVADYVEKHNLKLRIGKKCDFEKGEYETHLYDDVNHISFLCDGIIKYKGHVMIVEIKTMPNNKLFAIKKDPSQIAKYKRQATAYSLLLDIPEVMFLLQGRDLCMLHTVVYKPTKEEKEELLADIKMCNEYVKANKIPAKPSNINKSECAYCAYRKTCHKSESEFSIEEGE